EARRLLLIAVVADVVVVVARGGAAVARVLRRVLHDAVVLAGETGAGAEDRLVPAGQIDVLRRRVGEAPHLDVVGAAQPVRRRVAALDELGEEAAEDVALPTGQVRAL